MLRLAKVPRLTGSCFHRVARQCLQYESAHQMLLGGKGTLIDKRCFPGLVAAVVAVLAGASDAPLAKVPLITGSCFH